MVYIVYIHFGPWLGSWLLNLVRYPKYMVAKNHLMVIQHMQKLLINRQQNSHTNSHGMNHHSLYDNSTYNSALSKEHTFVVIVMVVVSQRNDYKFNNHVWSIPWSTTHVIVELVVVFDWLQPWLLTWMWYAQPYTTIQEIMNTYIYSVQ